MDSPSKGKEVSKGPSLDSLGSSRKFFMEEGFQQFPDVIDKLLLEDALRLINKELGKGSSAKTEFDNIKNGMQFRHLQSAPAIVNLFNKSPKLHKIVEEMIGPIHPVHGGQIALRFPGAMCCGDDLIAPSPWWSRGWHIDGLPQDGPDLKPGKIGNFTALIGVVLADVPDEFCGNLIVYPKSHFVIGEHIQKNGLDALLRNGNEGFPRILPFSPAKQIVAKAGDVTMCHYLTAHSIAPNTSPNIRYVIYFRVFSKTRPPYSFHPESMLNMWADWPLIRPLASSHHFLIPDGDEYVANLLPVAEEMMKNKNWEECSQLFQALVESRPTDYLINFQCALSLGFLAIQKGNGSLCADGEMAARRAIALIPALGRAYCVLARILRLLHRDREVLELVDEAFLADPVLQFESHDAHLAADLLKSIRDACGSLNRNGEFEVFKSKLQAKYPIFSTEGAQVKEEHDEASKLWEKGKTLIHKDPKTPQDWEAARVVFMRLAVLQPTTLWTLLLAGITHTYDFAIQGPLVVQGETYAHKAVEINPQSALPYSLLCRNLLRQRNSAKYSSLEQALANVLTAMDEGYTDVGEHSWLVLDTVRCAKEFFGAASLKFNEYLTQYKLHFPGLAFKASQIAQQEQCVIC